MGYAKRHIGSADVMVDEATGALLVRLGGEIVDVQALIQGIAGTKKLSDLHAALASLARESGGNLDDLAEAVEEIRDKVALEDDGNLQAARQYLADIVKEHRCNQRLNAFTGVTVATAGQPVRFCADSRPYLRAWVQAYKPGVTPESSSSSSSSSESSSSSSGGEPQPPAPPGMDFPAANSENVYLYRPDGDGHEKNSWVLAPGAAVELPPNGDLYDFVVNAASDGDGVIVMYEVCQSPAIPSSSSSSGSSSSSSEQSSSGSSSQ